ncbi:MAG: type 4a pilus biogenesis protein PilO [Candidatus Omnitrophica bacterium]|nr:type 4a pilus biogenesis protein PilO [Candidatus Omnitrophota bacterium]
MNVKNAQSGIIVICVLLTLGLFGLVAWQYSSMYKVEKALQQKVAQRDELENEIARVEEMLVKMERERRDFEKYLFQERDIPAFLDEISKFANDSLVSIIDMQTKNFRQVVVPTEYYQRNKKLTQAQVNQLREQQKENVLTLAAMPIQIKVEGTFSALVDFLDQLQNYEQLINISSVDIQAQKKYPKLNCNFTLSIYSLKSLEDLKRR